MGERSLLEDRWQALLCRCGGTLGPYKSGKRCARCDETPRYPVELQITPLSALRYALERNGL